ncbi:MAG: TIGR03435 family protein [Bryobacteraceae bacterium]
MLRIEIGIPQTRLVAPDWIIQGDQKFDISAKLPDPATKDQIPEMFLSLLEDRFGLAFHRESRELPIQALVVAKVGLKVQPATPESAQPAWVAASAKVPASSRRFVASTRNNSFSVQGPNGEQMNIIQSPSMGFVWRSVRQSEKMIRYEAPSITFEGLADLAVLAFASYGLGEELRDMTGLKGRYQVILEISSADLNADIRAQPFDLSVQKDAQFRVVQDGLKKLGLQLEPRKAPVELFVIDRLEKTPTEN